MADTGFLADFLTCGDVSLSVILCTLCRYVVCSQYMHQYMFFIPGPFIHALLRVLQDVATLVASIG